MALIYPRPILEIPSLEECRTDCHINLEQAIREDFGESGLARLKEYEVRVAMPVNTDEMLTFARIKLKDMGGNDLPYPKKTYTLSANSLDLVFAQNVGVMFDRCEKYTRLRLALDLNPDQTARYLNLIFLIPHVDRRR